MCVRGAAEHYHTNLWYFNMALPLIARVLSLLARAGRLPGKVFGSGGTMGAVGRAVTKGVPETRVMDAAGKVTVTAGRSAEKLTRQWEVYRRRGAVRFPSDPVKSKQYAMDSFQAWGAKNPEAWKQLNPGFFTRNPSALGHSLNYGILGAMVAPLLRAGGEGDGGSEEQQLMAMMAGMQQQQSGGQNQPYGGMDELMSQMQMSGEETSSQLAGTQGALRMKGIMDAKSSGRPSYRPDIEELTKGYEDLLGKISYKEPTTLSEALARRGIMPKDQDNRIDFRGLI